MVKKKAKAKGQSKRAKQKDKVSRVSWAQQKVKLEWQSANQSIKLHLFEPGLSHEQVKMFAMPVSMTVSGEVQHHT